MPVKSKAQFIKLLELTDEKKITPKQLREQIRTTQDPAKLPERVKKR